MENVPEKKANSLPSQDVKAWGAAESLDQSDLLVSKLFHQQSNSKFTESGLARPGDWCDSVTGEVLCKKDQVLELIIFSSYKLLQTFQFDVVKEKYFWLKSEPLTAENCIFDYYYEENGQKFKKQLVYNYFCLTLSKIEDLPFVLTLTSTKTKAAKKLNTMFTKLARHGKPSAAFVVNVTSVKEQNDQGTWFGVELSLGRETTAEELDTARDWYEKIQRSNVIVADEQDQTQTETGESKSLDDDIPF
jgi:hypothetical protein